jgi:protein-S-isoprenylcysteine O-methyltransferase Ste14
MLFLKLAGSVVLQFLLFAAMLFPAAGTLHWWHAWIFLGVITAGTIAVMFGVLSRDEELLKERYKLPVQRGQPLADMIVTLLLVVAFLGDVVMIPLDVFHLKLGDIPNVLVSSIGLVAVIAGWSLIGLALRANSFAAPVVKHQAERHQIVIDQGVYQMVRHPMYAGGALFMVGTPLWLGSYLAAGLAIVPIGLLAARILIEEQFLRRELDGYIAYTETIRYRMIPFVW